MKKKEPELSSYFSFKRRKKNLLSFFERNVRENREKGEKIFDFFFGGFKLFLP